MTTPFPSNRMTFIAMGAVLFAMGCALNARARSDVTLDDSDLFLAVVKSVQQSVYPVEIEIDPRPLKADPKILEPDPAAFAHISNETLEARRSLLRSVNVSPTEDPTYRHCAGVLTPPPLPGQRDAKASCPHRSFYVAAIGLSRAGEAYARGSTSNERYAGVKASHVAVRVLLTHLSPQGATMTAYDYVFKREAGAWNLVKRVSLYITD